MATVPKPTPFTNDEQVIRAIADDFVRGHEARNIDQLVNLYTDDAQYMMPFHPIVQGKNALRQAFEMAFQQYDQENLKVDTTFLQVIGDVAFGTGTFNVNVKLPTGKRIEDRGKWLVTFRRVGKTWKMAAHCWNTDLPFADFLS